MNLITPMEIHAYSRRIRRRQRVRRLWKKKIADGEARPGDDAIQAARVFKKSPTKLTVFQSILAEMDEDQRNQSLNAVSFLLQIWISAGNSDESSLVMTYLITNTLMRTIQRTSRCLEIVHF